MSTADDKPKSASWPTETPATPETLKVDSVFRSLQGRKVGSFRILSEIGKGGMGVVLKAHDETLDRTVAIKVLSAGLGEGNEFRERFLREARAAASLDHPNIVPVYSAGEDGELVYIAMQYVQGETLSALIRRNGRLSVRRALEIAREAALALGEAHRRGFIHRDIKPSNIMIDIAGRVKVMDFGLSRAISTSGRITQTGTYLGTPQYSSPEQCETQDLDGRTDIYSLGVCLYEMLTGRVPHVAETPVSLFRKIVEERPLPVQGINPNVPASVVRLLDRMMAKVRTQRPNPAEACAEEIQTLLAKEKLPATAADELPLRVPPATVGALSGFAPRRRPLALWAASGACVLAVGLAVWHAASRPPQPGPETTPGPVATTPNPPGPHPVTPFGNPVTHPPDPGISQNAAQTRLAITDFSNGSHNPEMDWLSVGIPELLLSALESDPRFRVLTRDELLADLASEKVKKQQVVQECTREEGDAGSDGRLALSPVVEQILVKRQVRVLVSGTYFAPRESSDVKIQARVILCAPGQSRHPVAVVTEKAPRAAIFDLVDAVAAKLMERIAGEELPIKSGTFAAARAAGKPAVEGASSRSFAARNLRQVAKVDRKNPQAGMQAQTLMPLDAEEAESHTDKSADGPSQDPADGGARKLKDKERDEAGADAGGETGTAAAAKAAGGVTEEAEAGKAEKNSKAPEEGKSHRPGGASAPGGAGKAPPAPATTPPAEPLAAPGARKPAALAAGDDAQSPIAGSTGGPVRRGVKGNPVEDLKRPAREAQDADYYLRTMVTFKITTLLESEPPLDPALATELKGLKDSVWNGDANLHAITDRVEKIQGLVTPSEGK